MPPARCAGAEPEDLPRHPLRMAGLPERPALKGAEPWVAGEEVELALRIVAGQKAHSQFADFDDERIGHDAIRRFDAALRCRIFVTFWCWLRRSAATTPEAWSRGLHFGEGE